jgi:hypothetical protein
MYVIIYTDTHALAKKQGTDKYRHAKVSNITLSQAQDSFILSPWLACYTPVRSTRKKARRICQVSRRAKRKFSLPSMFRCAWFALESPQARRSDNQSGALCCARFEFLVLRRCVFWRLYFAGEFTRPFGTQCADKPPTSTTSNGNKDFHSAAVSAVAPDKERERATSCSNQMIAHLTSVVAFSADLSPPRAA